MIGFASFPINTFDEECDNLILRDGNEILVKIIEITPDLIKYKRCKKEDGPLISVSKEDVFMIKYNDGTKELIELSKDNSRDRNIRTHTKKDRKGYIGITYGISYPIGDYAATGGEDAGYADRGNSLSLLNFYYKFNKNIGIAANWYGIGNPTDAQEIVEDIYRDNPSLSLEVTSGYWFVGGLSGGILISFPSNNIDFDLKALIGFASATTPQLDVTATEYNEALLVISSSQVAITSNNSASFSLGGGVRYHISKRWAVNLNLDYFTTKVEFPAGTNGTYSNGVAFQTSEFEQNISVLNLSIGIGYRL